MNFSFDLSSYLSNFFHDFTNSKHLEKYAKSSLKFVTPSLSAFLNVSIFIGVIYIVNLIFCIFSWKYFCIQLAIASTVCICFFSFSAIIELLNLKFHICRNFQGIFYVITTLLYSLLFFIFNDYIHAKYPNQIWITIYSQIIFEILSLFVAIFVTINWFWPSLAFTLQMICELILYFQFNSINDSLNYVFIILLSIFLTFLKVIIVYFIDKGGKVSFLAQLLDRKSVV